MSDANYCVNCRHRVTRFGIMGLKVYDCAAPAVRVHDYITGQQWNPSCAEVRRTPCEVRVLLDHCPHHEEKT